MVAATTIADFGLLAAGAVVFLVWRFVVVVAFFETAGFFFEEAGFLDTVLTVFFFETVFFFITTGFVSATGSVVLTADIFFDAAALFLPVLFFFLVAGVEVTAFVSSALVDGEFFLVAMSSVFFFLRSDSWSVEIVSDYTIKKKNVQMCTFFPFSFN